MSPEQLQAASQILVAVGSIAAAIGVWGTFHYGRKIDAAKETKVAENRVPLSRDEIETIGAQGSWYAAKIRTLPMAASVHTQELRPVAEKVWADPRYAEQAPKETALILRVYAATVLFGRPQEEGPLAQVRSALPWLRQAIELGRRRAGWSDQPQLESAGRYLAEVAGGSVPEADAEVMFTHKFRVAMSDASDQEVAAAVRQTISILQQLLSPRDASGSSPRDDLEYLEAYPVGGLPLGQLMKTKQMELKVRFPGKAVGGDPIFVPLPNGNTRVVYTFGGDDTLVYEWEVSRTRDLVTPLNAATVELMERLGKR